MIDESNLRRLRRFMMLAQIADYKADCWPWIGNRPDGRYGHFCPETGVTVKAHRWIYELACGPIPDGMVVRHKCDNPSCVNPDHLTVGTQKDNVADREFRGRGSDRRGEKHPLCRLTASDVIEIRRRHALGEPQAKIASDYPVKEKQIGKIIRRENWRHV